MPTVLKAGMSKSSQKIAKKAAKLARPAGLSEDETDVYVAENRDALNTSIKWARADFAKGMHSSRSVEEIVAEGKCRLQR